MLVLPTTADARILYQDHIKAHKSDSGLDLLCVADCNVPPGEAVRIGLGIKATVQEDGESVGWLVVPRSSLAKTPLRISSSVGVIDASYRGEVFAVFDHIGKEPFKIKNGDRLVQALSFSGKPLG